MSSLHLLRLLFTYFLFLFSVNSPARAAETPLSIQGVEGEMENIIDNICQICRAQCPEEDSLRGGFWKSLAIDKWRYVMSEVVE
jgi:hypothetical protein